MWRKTSANSAMTIFWIHTEKKLAKLKSGSLFKRGPPVFFVLLHIGEALKDTYM